MTLQNYHNTLSCKFTVTWNIHKAFIAQHGYALDVFTLLSSISWVVGTISQAYYAAGNAFQDAFVQSRRSLGLAAHSVNLGIIDDVGYISQNETLSSRVQSRSGLPRIGEAQLHEMLRLSVAQQTAGPNQERAITDV
ncbi:hypothetical protein PG999_011880 [Apiospora kogelbergensis]|uniref:Ketoreductase (KR) domain-containing protein n=1 Tax=Apiospora kogelbergensis TaxID=1337665 RepID=A0AAW0QGQ4_9PEZI